MPGGAQPFTFQFGPWAPDLANVAIQMQWQYGAAVLPCADCLNVYYADGTYKSFPQPVTIASTPNLPLGAFTAIDASGNPVPIYGGANAVFYYNGFYWQGFTGGSGFTAAQWSFAQFESSVYCVDASPTASTLTDGLSVIALNNTSLSPAGQIQLTGSITSNVLTVTAIAAGAQLIAGMTIAGIGITIGTNILSFGTGTGGTGTYNLTTTPNVGSITMTANIPPVGNVIGTAGQFLVQGDIGLQYANNVQGNNAYQLGTGNGTVTSWSGTIPNVPLRQKSVSVTVAGVTAVTDNGLGAFVSGPATGTINYATGAITINFLTPPANGALIAAVYTQAFPNRVWWSAIGNAAFWPYPLTNQALAFQSGYEDIEADLGPVMAIAGYPLYFLVFQRSGITRAIYQGGNVVFAFGTYEFKRGLLTRGAFIQVGPMCYFLSDQGWFSTDGANVTPIGTATDNSAGIDNWFWANVNKAALSVISAAYDAPSRSVIFAIPTGRNTLPDTLLIYNVLAQRWTRVQTPTTLIWTDTDGSRHRLAAFSQLTGVLYFYELFNGASQFLGYLESCDVMFVDGNTRTTVAARPNVNCTDTPVITIGTRNTLQSVVGYSATSAADAFGAGFAPVLSQGLYTRARVGSGAASAIHGATLQMVAGGPV